MATFNYWLDTRRAERNGKFSLKVMVRNKGTKCEIPLPPRFAFSAKEWDAESQHVKRVLPDFRTINRELDERMNELLDRFEELFGFMTQCSASVIAHRLADVRLSGDKMIGPVWEEYEAKRKTPASIRNYQYVHKSFLEFCPYFDELSFEEINKAWLLQFEDWALSSKEQPMSVNTCAMHKENLRAVFNYARNILEITTNYPFNGLKTAKRKYKKRPIMSDIELRKFLHYVPMLKKQEIYHDYWMLSFMLCGINMMDMYYLKDENIVNGRLEFDRKKTGVHVSIKIEPEMQRIMDRRKGKRGWLFDMRDQQDDKGDAAEKKFVDKLNNNIKRWGPYHREGRTQVVEEYTWKRYTCYTARHQWSSLAAELGASDHVIDMGLGHSETTITGRHYITTSIKRLDELNRKILIWCGLADKDNIEKYCLDNSLDYNVMNDKLLALYSGQ